MANFIYTNFPADFKNKFLGNDNAMAEFWSGIPEDDPRIRKLKTDHRNYKETCIPIVLHGDGVPCTNSHSLDTISFESLLAKRSTGELSSSVDSIFFCTGLFTQTMTTEAFGGKEKSKREMWKPLVHSFRSAYYGIMPSHDSDGAAFVDGTDNFKLKDQPVAGKYKLVAWVLKGDMDFNVNHFEIPGHWGSNTPCPTCPCTRDDNSPMAWNHFGDGALWKGMTFTDIDLYRIYCRSYTPPKQVPLIFTPLDDNGLGMHLKSSYKDTLHVADLGVSKHIGGSVLHELCYDILPGSAKENMDQIWNEIQQLYRAQQTSSQFSYLSLASFVTGTVDSPHANYPLLGGKGAEIRHLIPILNSIWRAHMRPGNNHDRMVERVLQMMTSFYECINYTDANGVHPFHLPAHIAAKLVKDIDRLLTFYSHLSRESMLNNVMRWYIVPKHHYLWHLADEATDLNPRMSWCYANEDFVGKISIIGMSTRHGQAAAFRSHALARKYILGLFLRMYHSLSAS